MSDNFDRFDDQLWLERMHPLLQWQIIAPRPDNPYGNPLSDAVLKELTEDKLALMKRVGLRCLFDGEEVLNIKNLVSLNYETTHPNLTTMKKSECEWYLIEYGIVDMIEREINAIQENFRAILEERKKVKKKRF